MTTYASNPPWVNRILCRHWSAIEKRIGTSALPLVERTGKPGAQLAHWPELGCGSYGCVLQTSEPGLVFKVTSDPSEAAFVTAALSLPQRSWPPGMIRYYDVFEFAGEKRQRRRVFGIVRAAATRVGGLAAAGGADFSFLHGKYSPGAGTLFLYQLQDFGKAAGTLHRVWKKKYVHRPWRDVLASPVGTVFIERCRGFAQQMAETEPGHLVGTALLYYLSQGMLLADVHPGNVGEAVFPKKGAAGIVITDPGHMVPLDPKWLSVQVPQL